MTESYRVGDTFNLMRFARNLTGYLDSKCFWSAKLKQETQYLCSVYVRKSTHQGVIRLVLINKHLQLFVNEEIESVMKNIGAVAMTIVFGFVIGKDKIFGKSMFMTSGYKTIENMKFKNTIKRNINGFTRNYLKNI